MTNSNTKAWVSADWLNNHLQDSNIVILDATLDFMPNGEKVAEPSAKIVGAYRFNFDTEICQPDTDLPHMMPDPSSFEKAVQAIGINQDSNIVIYDAMGVFSSPRAWWMFKVMGHAKVRILNGGLPGWQKAGYPLSNNYQPPKNGGNFKANCTAENILSKSDVLSRISAAEKNNRTMIIDARSWQRFSGEQAEPRAGLAKGHIPGSICLPFDSLLDNGYFKSDEEIRQAFEQCNDSMLTCDNEKEIIYSCGSGVTACVLAIAGYHIGIERFKIYDGSWAEWGADSCLPVETGRG